MTRNRHVSSAARPAVSPLLHAGEGGFNSATGAAAAACLDARCGGCSGCGCALSKRSDRALHVDVQVASPARVCVRVCL